MRMCNESGKDENNCRIKRNDVNLEVYLPCGGFDKGVARFKLNFFL